MVGEFDDDLFDTPKAKTFIDNQNYEPKYCFHEWYEYVDSSSDCDTIQILKFRADRTYVAGDYQNALTYFKRLSQDSHSMSPQMSREVTESIARTYLKLKNTEEALRIAQELCEHSITVNHKTCSWMLLASVHHEMKMYSSEVQTYMKLLQIHPLNDQFWILLAEALACHWGITLSESVIHTNVDHIYNSEPFLPRDAQKYSSYILGCCVIRARIIIQSCHQRLLSSGLPKYSKAREKVDGWLAKLQITQQFQDQATEILSKDVSKDEINQCEFEDPDKIKDLETSESSNVWNSDNLQFFNRWFGWIYDYIT